MVGVVDMYGFGGHTDDRRIPGQKFLSFQKIWFAGLNRIGTSECLTQRRRVFLNLHASA
jgi:hypothetical protein